MILISSTHLTRLINQIHVLCFSFFKKKKKKLGSRVPRYQNYILFLCAPFELCGQRVAHAYPSSCGGGNMILALLMILEHEWICHG